MRQAARGCASLNPAVRIGADEVAATSHETERQVRIVSGMARKLRPRDVTRPPPFRLIPASVCDGCGRFGCGLHAAASIDTPGVACDCGGHQRHSQLWTFWWCPLCRGPGCDACRWKGLVATPRD